MVVKKSSQWLSIVNRDQQIANSGRKTINNYVIEQMWYRVLSAIFEKQIQILRKRLQKKKWKTFDLVEL